jgi:DNA repair ATPase RecN
MSLTKEEFGLISTIAEGVRHIRETEFPEIKADVREARDLSRTAIQDIHQINFRVSSLEEASPIPMPIHSCSQVQTITEIKTSLDKASEIKKYLIPIFVTLAMALIGFVTTSIRTETSIREDVEQHENKITEIQSIQNSQTKNLSDVINRIGAASKQLDEISKNLNSKSSDVNVIFEDRLKEYPPRERDKLREVWREDGNNRN